MKITKLWHCCLLIETKGKRLLTDPGMFTVEKHAVFTDINAIIFTHDHPDHYHRDSLTILLQNNPHTKVFCNTSTSTLLATSNIEHITIRDGETVDFHGVLISGYGTQHAIIHSSFPIFENTGYMIDEKLFYPGDAFINPGKPVDVLALPVAWPWVKIGESVDYALALKPRIAFPIHDFFRFGWAHAVPAKVLPENGIEFIPMVEGDSREF